MLASSERIRCKGMCYGLDFFHAEGVLCETVGIAIATENGSMSIKGFHEMGEAAFWTKNGSLWSWMLSIMMSSKCGF
jgi:hypothetical protein